MIQFKCLFFVKHAQVRSLYEGATSSKSTTEFMSSIVGTVVWFWTTCGCDVCLIRQKGSTDETQKVIVCCYL
ncbi:hypothetical protein SETIT_4G143800v2 [Setaria italica]|uniref:Uncharacterized protein n=2 Tax=Setaria TaxID=4554 RepID=A0A368QUK9_SETIT|nr:hypothetical protein SETIT_4G143800v2 [Setaria italica]TKW21286.1 hypothetical protein SEVIR_4G169100v2 [Setaria viridis]